MEGNLFSPDLSALLKRTVPGYQAVFGLEGHERAFILSGHAVLTPKKVLVRDDTLFDCASLTKPLITAALALQLARKGIIDLEKPPVLPENFKPFPFGIPTVRNLLEHRAGMPAWTPLTLIGTPDRIRPLLPALQVRPPSGETLYSCPGFILLGESLSCVTGKSLASLTQTHLLRPLQIESDAFFPLPGVKSIHLRTAATERGNPTEREMAGGNLPRRASPIRGEVHDGNAFHLGGAAGNAGLFATARAVMTLGFHLLTLLPRHGRHRHSYYLGLHTSIESTLFPRGFLGHTGFTGTLLLLHPARNAIGVLLTNNIHAARPRDLAPLRRSFISTCQNALKRLK